MAKPVNRQMGYRTFHSSEVLGNDLIIWGGNQDGLLDDHDSEKKRSITTNLDILDLPTMEWNKVSTDGTPPAGAKDYSTATVGEEMYVFGGRCDYNGDCVHNDLHQLNTNNKVWRSIPCTNRPIKKYSCGFISYCYQGSNYILALGGEGEQPTEPQTHSLYTRCYSTNEVHIMNITTSLGTWISPTVTGDRPPPISEFTLNQLPNGRSKAVLFGGRIVPKTDKMQCSNDIYTLSLTSDTVEFTKLSKRLFSLWPKPRRNHSSTIITNGTEDHLIVIGGEDDHWSKLAAGCWLLNITTKRWSQIDLPQSVCARKYHSVSSVTMNTNTQWIIVTGGYDGVRGSLIKGVEVTMIVELEYSSHGWLVGGVWNSSQKMELTERMKRIRPAKKLPANDETLRKIESMTQEIQQLRQQLHTSQQIQQQQNTELADKHKVNQQLTNDNRQLTDDNRQLIDDYRQLTDDYRQLTDDIEQLQAEKDHDNQQFIIRIKQLQTNVAEKDCVNQQLIQQIEQLQANIAEDCSVIERHENTITKQQEEIFCYRDNPPWLIEQEEVVLTQEVLGKGGCGEVKVGMFRGTRVAVKTLHDLILSDYYLQLFSREMDIASRVRHPNLLQFIGATRVGNPQILTELMPTSLRKELEKCSMTRQQVLSVGIDVASGLNYLHCWRPHSILHRDVSSANVLLEPSGNVQWKAKLSDYGSAILVENIQTANPGSPVYSAPEAKNPAQHSPAMDIYSFGVLLLEMATGQFPPSVEHEREALIQNVRWTTVKAFIIRCTSTVPSFRPTTNNVLQQLRNM